MAPSFTLTMKAGPDAGQQTQLQRHSLLIGRDPVCDLPVNDVEVSRRHARLLAQSGGYSIEDLGSMNGTFVNEQRITTILSLKDGDTVRLGDTIVFVYEELADEEEETRGMPVDTEPAPPPAPPAPRADPQKPISRPAPRSAPQPDPLESSPLDKFEELPAPSTRRRPRRQGMRLPLFTSPWMTVAALVLAAVLCMSVFLYLVDVFNLWCSLLGWLLNIFGSYCA
jgi:pSer/pThr/pTyr-binding forkhead associated (FHA) protein